MRFLILFFLSLNLTVTFAQNWELFALNQNSYYLDLQSGQLEGIVVDSVKTLTAEHTIAYFNTNEIHCIDEIKNNQAHNFPSLYLDSLMTKGDTVFCYPLGIATPFYFYPHASKNDHWNFTTNQNVLIEIVCTDEKEELVFGVMDSVKVFELTVGLPLKAKDNNRIQSLSNIFRLSKKFGLIEFAPFKEFFAAPQEIEISTMKMVGLDDVQPKGYKLPEFQDYFPLNEGDVVKWEKDYNSSIHIKDYNRDSITKVFVQNDTVFYQFDSKRWSNLDNKVEELKGITGYMAKKKISPFSTTLPGFFAAEIHVEGVATIYKVEFQLMISEDDTITELSYSTLGILDLLDCEWYPFHTRIQNIMNTERGKIYSLEETIDYKYESRLVGSKISGKSTGTLDVPTGIIDKVTIKSINVFPNPATNCINLNLEPTSKIDYVIYNSLGKVIQNGVLTSNQLDVASLPDGMYFLNIQNGKTFYSGTFGKE